MVKSYSYSSFVLINLILISVLAFLSLIFGSGLVSKLIVFLTTLSAFLVLILSKGKGFNFLNVLSPRVVVLTLFVLAVFLGFAHYIFAFSEQVGLVAISYIFSFFILITLIFTNFKNTI